MLKKLICLSLFWSLHAVAFDFDVDAPQSEKAEKLSDYFSPRPGEIVTVDFNDFKNKGREPTEHYGQIEVNPPKGVCFNIVISRPEGDKYVCKKTKLNFKIRDIDLDGSFEWTITVNERDFGTTLKWQTPYRVGRVVKTEDPWPGPSSPVFLKSCKEITTGIGKKIQLELFDSTKWVIRFPEVHINSSVDCEKQDKNKKLKKSQKKTKDLTNIQIKSKVKKKVEKCYSKWQTINKIAYDMDGDGFTPGVGVPTKTGSCRYAYKHYKDDPASGSLECLSVFKYNWVYIPLTCLTKPDFIK